MTRHKQQLLQEQESLLEQIQKRNSTDTNEINSNEATDQNATTTSTSPQDCEGQKNRRSSRNSPFKDGNKSTIDHEGKHKQWGVNEDNNTLRKSSTPTLSMIASNLVTPGSIVSPQGLSPTEMRSNLEHSGRLMAMLRDNSPSQGASSNTPSTSAVASPPSLPGRTDRFSPLSPREHQHQHMKRPAANSNPFSHRMEEVKLLDNSLFGRPLVSFFVHYWCSENLRMFPYICKDTVYGKFINRTWQKFCSSSKKTNKKLAITQVGNFYAHDLSQMRPNVH